MICLVLFLVKVSGCLMTTEPVEEDIAANEVCTIPQEEDAAQPEMALLISGPIQGYRDSNLNYWGYKRFS